MSQPVYISRTYNKENCSFPEAFATSTLGAPIVRRLSYREGSFVFALGVASIAFAAFYALKPVYNYLRTGKWIIPEAVTGAYRTLKYYGGCLLFAGMGGALFYLQRNAIRYICKNFNIKDFGRGLADGIYMPKETLTQLGRLPWGIDKFHDAGYQCYTPIGLENMRRYSTWLATQNVDKGEYDSALEDAYAARQAADGTLERTDLARAVHDAARELPDPKPPCLGQEFRDFPTEAELREIYQTG